MIFNLWRDVVLREVGRLFIGDNIHSDQQAAQVEIGAPLTDVEPSATPVPVDAPLVIHNPVSTLQTTNFKYSTGT